MKYLVEVADAFDPSLVAASLVAFVEIERPVVVGETLAVHFASADC